MEERQINVEYLANGTEVQPRSIMPRTRSTVSLHCFRHLHSSIKVVRGNEIYAVRTGLIRSGRHALSERTNAKMLGG